MATTSRFSLSAPFTAGSQHSFTRDCIPPNSARLLGFGGYAIKWKCPLYPLQAPYRYCASTSAYKYPPSSFIRRDRVPTQYSTNIPSSFELYAALHQRRNLIQNLIRYLLQVTWCGEAHCPPPCSPASKARPQELFPKILTGAVKCTYCALLVIL